MIVGSVALFRDAPQCLDCEPGRLEAFLYQLTVL